MTDVGIVMPVYKQKPEFLAIAIQSVLAQTYQKFRFILVIDGAPEMEPLVRAQVGQDQRVEVLSYPDNKGVAHALNTGFEPLLEDDRIQYLTWVSSDNSYDPHYLEVLRAALVQSLPELGLVYSSFRSIDDEGRQLMSEAELASMRHYQSQSEEKLLDSSIVGISFMYKSSYARLTGPYGMQPVEDYDYWLRLTEHCRMKHLPVELVDYRVNSSFSISASLKSELAHRRWRYAYHLTRHQARKRRGVSSPLTVLFPLVHAREHEVAIMENVYEQTYSNYTFTVLDLSESGQPTELLSSISHPTTSFNSFPGMKVTNSLLYASYSISTPYTLVLGPKLFEAAVDLQNLLDHANQKGQPNEISWFFPQGKIPRLPSSRLSSGNGLVDKPDIFHEVFRTKSLQQLLNNIVNGG
ncbi:glycosyltransferase family 2 protein [Paenibacillus herberti]|uniref:Glycosyl transferase n=1 Tax=Paenibacillus herberti TaxID=1619309 RepID=A0A229NXN0_9BACL|nr:glycosyltransferase [Paenibacillus herberti]OXM14692.1 glycosyl transferase [Paenibacillus herberti]